jgi:hypothetical protein
MTDSCSQRTQPDLGAFSSDNNQIKIRISRLQMANDLSIYSTVTRAVSQICLFRYVLREIFM